MCSFREGRGRNARCAAGGFLRSIMHEGSECSCDAMRHRPNHAARGGRAVLIGRRVVVRLRSDARRPDTPRTAVRLPQLRQQAAARSRAPITPCVNSRACYSWAPSSLDDEWALMVSAKVAISISCSARNFSTQYPSSWASSRLRGFWDFWSMSDSMFERSFSMLLSVNEKIQCAVNRHLHFAKLC